MIKKKDKNIAGRNKLEAVDSSDKQLPTPGGLLWFLDQGAKVQAIETEQNVVDYGREVSDANLKTKRPSSHGTTKLETLSSKALKSVKSSGNPCGKTRDRAFMKPFRPNKRLPYDEESGTFLPPQHTLNRAIKRAEDKFVKEMFSNEEGPQTPKKKRISRKSKKLTISPSEKMEFSNN